MKNPVPRTAAIHDLSGFGRASLTVIVPILSTLGIQVCPVPTAVLSTHTGGFTDYSFIDLTENMKKTIQHWKNLEIAFDAIYSGFLGSPEQIHIVSDFIESFRKEDQLKVIDPVRPVCLLLSEPGMSGDDDRVHFKIHRGRTAGSPGQPGFGKI